MLIDCDHCAARPAACDHCVVGVLLGTPDVPARDTAAGGPAIGGPVVEAAPQPREPGGPLPLEFGPVEQRALEVLADHGLIPRLRLIASEPASDGSAQPRAADGRRGDDRSARGRRDVG